MELVDGYPIIVTDRLLECHEFYGRWFGFQVPFEAKWIVGLRSSGDRAITMAFMHSEHPSSPPSPAAYEGDRMFITFQVADARAEYVRLAAGGLRCDLELIDEPRGQRRFGVTDPAGMWVDVVEQIEPATDWWKPYLAST